MIGLDIDPELRIIGESRIAIYAGNSIVKQHTDEVLTSEASHLAVQGAFLQLVIDDGCHSSLCQRASLHNIWPYLAVGGIYIIEDIRPADAPAFVAELAAHGATVFSAAASAATGHSTAVVLLKRGAGEVPVREADLLAPWHVSERYARCWDGISDAEQFTCCGLGPPYSEHYRCLDPIWNYHNCCAPYVIEASLLGKHVPRTFPVRA